MEKTEDSLFDDFIETRIVDGKLEAKLKEPGADEEMELAVMDMVKSWREFRDLNSEGPIAVHTYGWWKALMYLSLAEDRLKTAFTAGDRSPASIKQYHKWRLKMIDGRRYRTDA